MWKAFWASLGADIKSFFVGHWMRLLGFVIAYLAAPAFFVAAYATKTEGKEGLSIPLAIWLVAIPLLAIYWGKARRSIDLKLSEMKAVNEMDASRHYAGIVLAESLKSIMTLATILLVYYVIRMGEQIFAKASTAVLVIAVCYGIGGLFFVLDAVFTRAPKDVEIAMPGPSTPPPSPRKPKKRHK